MPEFILDTGDKAEDFASLPTFVQGYIEALFFTQSGPEEGELGEAGFADLAPRARVGIARECYDFQEAASPLLLEAYSRDYDEAQAGRDFWFTRNRHGAGFWDRDVLFMGGLGDKLTDVAHEFGEVYAYLGDGDGKVYVS